MAINKIVEIIMEDSFTKFLLHNGKGYFMDANTATFSDSTVT